MKKILMLSFLMALSLSVFAQRSGSTTGLNDASLKVLTMLPVDSLPQATT